MAAFLLSDQAKQPAVKAAHDIAERAAETSVRKTGEFAAGYRVNEDVVVTVGGNPRASAEVYNSDPAAPSQEFGGVTKNGKEYGGHRRLRQAASAAGPPPTGAPL